MPTRGIERWLVQRLSTRLGTERRPGRRRVRQHRLPVPRSPGRPGPAAAASGVDPDTTRGPRARGLAPARRRRRLPRRALARPLAAHLARRPGGGRRTAVRRRPPHRRPLRPLRRAPPEMVRAWAAGRDDAGARRRPTPAGRRSCGAGCGTARGAEPGRAPCRRLRSGLRDRARARRPARAAVAVRPDPPPASYLDVLAALAAGRDVHLFLLHPSPALGPGRRRHRAGPTAPASGRRPDRRAQVANPLLGSWGRDAREMQLVLPGDRGRASTAATTAAGDRAAVRHPARRGSRPTSGPTGPRPALPLPGRPDPGRRSTRRPQHPGPRLPRPGPPGRGPPRRHPPPAGRRPDPRAPRRDRHVPGHRGLRPAHRRHLRRRPQSRRRPATTAGGSVPDLRVRLADRSLRQTNPVLGVVAHCSSWPRPGSRPPRSSTWPAASRSAAASASTTTTSAASSSGSSAPACAGASTPSTGRRSGSASSRPTPGGPGLDRTLLGVAMADAEPAPRRRRRAPRRRRQRRHRPRRPLRRAGRPARRARLGDFAEAMPFAAWAERHRRGHRRADAPRRSATPGSRPQLQRLLDDVVDRGRRARTARSQPRRPRPGRRPALLARPAAGAARPGPTSAPASSPCARWCRCGRCPTGWCACSAWTTASSPGAGERDGDDLIAGRSRASATATPAARTASSSSTPCWPPPTTSSSPTPAATSAPICERPRPCRSASCSTSSTAPCAPAGPAGRARAPGRRAPSAATLRRPQLQPRRARRAAGRGASTPSTSRGRSCRTRRGRPAGPFLAGPLPDAGPPAVELGQLERFLRHPARAFLRERLGIYRDSRTEEIDDALPVELDALAEWGVGDRLLARPAGRRRRRVLPGRRAGPGPPPAGRPGRTDARKVAATVEEIVAVAGAGGARRTRSTCTWSSPTASRHRHGRRASPVMSSRTTAYSRLGPVHRLLAWVRLLALGVGRPPRAPLRGRDHRARRKADRVRRGERPRLGPLGARSPRPPGRGHGRAHPTGRAVPARPARAAPAGCKTSAAWAASGSPARPRLAAAGSGTAPTTDRAKSDDPEHRWCSAAAVRFERLLDEAPRPDEAGDGWPGRGDAGFGRYAQRLLGSAARRSATQTGRPATGRPATAALRHLRAAAAGVTLLEAERGDGQDLHHRRPRHPLRRRRGGAGPAAGGDVHPHGHRRAA